MSKKLLDVDPYTGLITTTDFQDGKNFVGYEQDVSKHLDHAARLRNDPDYWRRGVKESFAHAAFVPDYVILDMRERFGVNFYDKDQRKRVLQLLESEYPKCKTTDKKLA
jgi:hypothetical protein